MLRHLIYNKYLLNQKPPIYNITVTKSISPCFFCNGSGFTNCSCNTPYFSFMILSRFYNCVLCENGKVKCWCCNGTGIKK